MPTPMNERTIDATFVETLELNPLQTIIDFYASRLSLNENAIAFLIGECGITAEQAAEQQIGFSDRRLGKNLPNTDSRRGRDLRKQLKEIGIYKSSGHEALRGCITIPLFADDGETITGVHGRRIDKHGKGEQEITIGSGAARIQDSRFRH